MQYVDCLQADHASPDIGQDLNDEHLENMSEDQKYSVLKLFEALNTTEHVSTPAPQLSEEEMAIKAKVEDMTSEWLAGESAQVHVDPENYMAAAIKDIESDAPRRPN